MKKAALIAYSRRGLMTAGKVRDCLPDADCSLFAPERLAAAPAGTCGARSSSFRSSEDPVGVPVKTITVQPIGQDTEAFYGELFRQYDALIFVGALGIAVRSVAPHIRDKRTDPAVICIDELGLHVIPVLSGHIGGANRLAVRIADGIGSEAVITTATDLNGKFSVDSWATRHDLIIDDMNMAKAVSAAVLEGEAGFRSDVPVSGDLPDGLMMVPRSPEQVENGAMPETGLYVSWSTREPFRHTLRLIPKAVYLGIGCRRGTTGGQIRAAVEAFLLENGIDRRSVKAVCTIDLKKEEAGLLAYCEQEGWKPYFYTAEELSRAEGDFAASGFVLDVTGVDNVCERAAMMQADVLIARKTAFSGVTAAAGAALIPLTFS